MKNKVSLIISAIFLLATSISVNAADCGYIPDFEIQESSVMEVPVYIQSPVDDFEGFQTEIEISDSFSFSFDSSSFAEFIDDYKSGYQIASNINGKTLKVVGFATDSEKRFGNGEIFKIRIAAPSDCNVYTITVKNTRVSKGDQEYILENSTSHVTVIPVAAQSISLSLDNLEMHVSDWAQLFASVYPYNTTDKTVIWSSSDETVAYVDNDGRVTAIAPGTADITARCGDVTATCRVTVKPIQATSIVLNIETAILKIGETMQLTATVFPENATDKTVAWSSSAEAVAKVDNNGLVTAVGVGSITIFARCGDVTARCLLSVNPILATSIVLNTDFVSLKMGETVQLTATVFPENTTDKIITWSSSDETIAHVDNDGRVTAIAPGTADITARCGDATTTCRVTIASIVEYIRITYYEPYMTRKETKQFKAEVYPEEAVDQKVIWKSSDEAVATVDENGVVTAVSVGWAIISASCGDHSDNVILTVEPIMINSITFDIEEMIAVDGDEFTITATVDPEDADNKLLEWISSNTEVAVVDGEGHVKVLRRGDCLILASATDGSGASAVCRLTALSGIDEIVNECEGPVDIYTVTGVCIKRDATREDVEKLRPGMYIVGGRKYVVTK